MEYIHFRIAHDNGPSFVARSTIFHLRIDEFQLSPIRLIPLSNRMYDIYRKYTHAHLNRARERASGGRKFRSIRTLYAAVKPVKGSPFGRVYHAHPHERAIYRTSVRAREGEMLGARTKVRRRRRTGQEAENTDGHCRGRPLP